MSHSWLDKDFIEKALGKEIVNFEVKPFDAINCTSSVFAVQVQLKTNAKEHLFVKKLIDTQDGQQSVKETSMFERETHMYRVVLPKMSALLEKAIPGCEPIAPRHVYSNAEVLVLEDLSASNFRIMDVKKGLDLHQSLLVMKTLAKFHSASIILHEEDPQCFKIYDHHLFIEPAMKQSVGQFYTSMTRMLADDMVNWPDIGERYSKKIREISGKMIELAAEAVRRREDRLNVLGHNDLWVNNILFRSPDGVRFIDFQMSHYASPGNDIQSFMYSSLKPEVRRNHRGDLLKEYHKTFNDTLTALGYEGRMLTFEEFQEQVKKSAPYALLMCIVFVPLMFVQPDAEISLFETKIDQTIGKLNNVKAREMLMEMLHELEEQGASVFDF
ncbi:hypothetical protein L9F63_002942 [Diploptera punctata]|uniref:CHK kinase-like domain-containing protein n=1 Tax=Diploptera punctata TaxID=6984 RepID=A0AAD7ZSB4_DIPPU|nr:hypothetical protein L9F63_002942 [Diploptera punctata]